MTDVKEELLYLLGKEALLPEEKEWLLNYIEHTDQQELKNILNAEFDNHISNPKPIDPFISQKILTDIHTKIGAQKKSRIIPLWVKRIAVAASIIGIVSFSAYFFLLNKTGTVTRPIAKTDIYPATEKAILTLNDGSKIKLDEIKDGTVISQSNSNIVKTNGKLAYSNVKNNITATAFNTLSTPRAGRYHVELPDGTKVWLNAASSIHYPTAFTGDKRIVEITGEAYFEVAKNKQMPFIVKVNKSEVRVYGTHFNVMAYNDESAVKTTLLEGSVKCINGQASCMLKPGQQSVLNKTGQFKVAPHVNVGEAIAWKTGSFHFENVSIEVVMRQLSRAYDVDVVYNKTVNDTFFADIPSQSQLSEVLKVLELTGKVSFEIKGREIIVNP